ncbi:hypothetical protein BFJ72_g15397, partial [Fusarium proliferatum]
MAQHRPRFGPVNPGGDREAQAAHGIAGCGAAPWTRASAAAGPATIPGFRRWLLIPADTLQHALWPRQGRNCGTSFPGGTCPLAPRPASRYRRPVRAVGSTGRKRRAGDAAAWQIQQHLLPDPQGE